MRRKLALSRHDLHARLERIDAEGWDGRTARELLSYVRENLVRIQVNTTGLSGPAAEQAEATGWAVAWELLASPAIRTARSPWALLWISVRRAVRGEWATGLYLAKARTAWELRANLGAGLGWAQTPLSWDRLADDGCEPAADPAGQDQPLLARVVELLTDAGWDAELAAEVVLRLAEKARPGPGGTVMGWRRVAAEFDLPPWQAHRVVLALQSAAAEQLGAGDGIDEQGRVLDPSERWDKLVEVWNGRRPIPVWQLFARERVRDIFAPSFRR